MKFKSISFDPVTLVLVVVTIILAVNGKYEAGIITSALCGTLGMKFTVKKKDTGIFFGNLSRKE